MLISKLVLLLATLLYIDDTDLYVFHSGCDSTKEVVQKVQKLLNIWHKVLLVTGSNLKLSKYYWILHNYQWRNRKYTSVVSTSFKLSIDTNKLA